MAKSLPALEPFELSELVAFRLDPKTKRQLRHKAHKMGIGHTVLIRMWIMERLQKEKSVDQTK